MGYEADDSFKSFEVEFNSESSPMTHKADASSAMGSPEAGGQRDLDVGRLADEKSEHGAGVVKSDDFDENRRAVGHGESLESAGRAWDPSPRQNRSEILELVRCPHRLAELLVQGMELAGVDLVDCLAGCGHRLVEAGHSVLFAPAYRLVQELLAAKRDLDLPRRLRKLDNFDFLLLDDLGYLPQGAEESEVLFTLIAERYERRSLGITSNLVFSEWERIFANPMATAAAIDRVVHHSVILEFDVPSYRTNAAQQRGQAKEVNRQN